VISEIIRKDLGRPVSEVFSYIDPTPLASASVAQVHVGRLKNGEEVAIKVQKPQIEDTLKGKAYIQGPMVVVVVWCLSGGGGGGQ